MDVDAIRAGEDFVRIIEQTIASTDILIALIGRNWLESRDDAGRPRLQNPADFVRLEIAHALRRGIPVIPVLVGGASVPAAGALPDELKPLSSRNALEIHDALFRESVQRLIQELNSRSPGRRLDSKSLGVRFAAGGAALALIAAALAVFSPGSKTPETHNTDRVPDLDRSFTLPIKPVKVRTPTNVTQIPEPVEGARNFLELPGRHDVNGPRRPKVLWTAPVTMWGTQEIVGIVGDGTAFIWNHERGLLSASSNGTEWAYREEPPVKWSLSGFDAEGRAWLSGNESIESRRGVYINRDVAYCFNSRGEGGRVAQRVPYTVVHPGTTSDSVDQGSRFSCEGGKVSSEGRKHWRVELDGNCPDWGVVRDAKGGLYTSSDAGTFYAIAPDGAVRWRLQAGFQTGKPFFIADDVVFGSAQGLFRIHEGTQLWRFPVNQGVTYYQSGRPVFDKTGAIYFRDGETLVAVSNDGKLLWKYNHAVPVALDQQGRLYVLGGRGIACLGD